MDFIKEKIRVSIENLISFKTTHCENLSVEFFHTDGYKKGTEIPVDSSAWCCLEPDRQFDGVDEHYWLKINVPAVKAQKNKALYFSLKTGREGKWDASNPQGLIYIDGKAMQALDTNHTELLLEFEKEYTLYIYFYTGMAGGSFSIKAALSLTDLPTEQLFYDINVPFVAMAHYSESSYDYIQIRNCLDKALMLVDFRNPYSDGYYTSLENAIDYMRREFYEGICGKSNGVISCIGHTHIDVAWLWTVAQTREKAERSFSTALRLMEQYPEYKFMSSQPQLYKFVKEDNPELYARIKERVKEGRWIVEGAMWLEADCNIPSGESLVRQIIFGKRFMKEEFGVESRILWLPDVFGYNAALPQILVKSGVDRFFTSKISWNDTNTMPHDMFLWKGIDGTEIFTSFIKTYVNVLSPSCVMNNAWNVFKDKSLSDRTLITFGYGDGGGGTTADMMENFRRMSYGIPGLPRTEIDTPNDYYDKIEADFEKNTTELKSTPKWDGELYLEMHRGTYTSMAKNKRNNRKSELLYQEAETLSVTDEILNGGNYDRDVFNKNWENILLNQFHDIIPGSSIKEVYDVTDAEYTSILSEGRAIVDSKLKALADGTKADDGILCYNPTPYTQSDIILFNGELYAANEIPSHGYKVLSKSATKYGVTVSERSMENSLVRVTFDDDWQITSVYDKEVDREVIALGSKANRLEVYEDYPRAYDAWELNNYYKQKMWPVKDATCTPIENGFRIVRKYNNSVIRQDITLKNGSKRIDFATEVAWHEDHVLLKTAFPLDIRTTFATYDIQFGNIARPTHQNTSWDAAKFEVCGHKWADMSENDYGVSLINDCKYGYSAYENELTLSLLKAATYPNPSADRGVHSFTYSLYPHTGNVTAGGTIRESYLLNMPLQAVAVSPTAGTMPNDFSLVSCDSENICVETVKKAELDDSIIVRLYDNFNQKSLPTLTFGFDFKEAYLCNLIEENETKLDFTGRSITIPVKNFEIVTLKLVI